MRGLRLLALAMALAAALFADPAARADALQPIHFGKSIASLFHYTPVDVGIAEGIFEKHGLAVDTISFPGDAKLHQALTAGAVDIGVGSGPSLAFIAKGTPALGIAEAAGMPLGSSLVVLKDGPVKTIADMKGRIASVSTVGSQTDWMVRELSRQQGWGSDGIQIAALGALPAQIAALKTKQIDGVTADIATAYRMEETGDGRILLKFGDIIPNYVNSVLFASNSLIADHPDEVRAFLAAWFEAVAFMKANKAEAVRVDAAVLKIPEPIVARVYDETFRMISPDGRFDAKGLQVLDRSFVEMGMLSSPPDMAKLYTERFLPAAK